MSEHSKNRIIPESPTRDASPIQKVTATYLNFIKDSPLSESEKFRGKMRLLGAHIDAAASLNQALAASGSAPLSVQANGQIISALQTIEALFEEQSITLPGPFQETCTGTCKFKITIEYDYANVGVDKQTTKFKFKIHEEEDSENCDGEFGAGEGRLDFKEKGKEPCKIRSAEDWENSRDNCGTIVTGVSELEKAADFGYIHIDLKHKIECCPKPPCHGKCSEGVMHVQFFFNSGTGEVIHNGSEPPDPPGAGGTKTVTFEETLVCVGTT